MFTKFDLIDGSASLHETIPLEVGRQEFKKVTVLSRDECF